MTSSMTVGHLGADRFTIEVRRHSILVDQPVEDGGEDSAPTPTELFVASLASCVAFYARRYLARHGVPTDGLGVSIDYEMGGKPARVSDISIRVTPPDELPPERHKAFLAVASHCTVHNTLMQPPGVAISLDVESATS